MTANLSFRTNPFTRSVGTLAITSKGSSEIEKLREKMNNFKLRMENVNQKTDLILQEQKEMFQAQTFMKRNHKEMRGTIQIIETRDKKKAQRAKLIQKNQELIRSYFQAISLKWGRLFPMAEGIQRNQKGMFLNLKKIKQNKKAVLNQAIVIQNNGEVIRKNHLQANLKLDQIQLNAARIQLNHTAIRFHEMQIEEEKLQIFDKLESMEMEKLKKPMQTVSHDSESSSFWISILQKIIDYSLLVFAAITKVIENCQSTIYFKFGTFKESLE